MYWQRIHSFIVWLFDDAADSFYDDYMWNTVCLKVKLHHPTHMPLLWEKFLLLYYYQIIFSQTAYRFVICFFAITAVNILYSNTFKNAGTFAELVDISLGDLLWLLANFLILQSTHRWSGNDIVKRIQVVWIKWQRIDRLRVQIGF